MTVAADIGLVGLGTMGSALALNIAEQGFAIAVYDRHWEVTEAFLAEAGALATRIIPCRDYAGLVTAVRQPRAFILLVTAGKPVDLVTEALAPLLDADDIIIDAGNSNFHDTIARHERGQTAEHHYQWMGIGISGGEQGARHGPSIMAGGAPSSWSRVGDILQAIAAKHEGEPCAAYLGADGAGHFVKTVHNGIEYADMQIIAEAYGLMRDGLGMTAAEIGNIFAQWNQGALRSYLIDISAKVAQTTDPETGQALLDVILDQAGQKGTGRWAAIEAQHLGAPVVTIEAAVAARNISARRGLRMQGEALFGAAPTRLEVEATALIAQLERAVFAGKIACYAQGFAMLQAASAHYHWSLPLAEVAKVWREGCIIRSAMLDDMATALAAPEFTNLLFSPTFAEHLKATHRDLREMVALGTTSGSPMPALSSALSYFDMMRTARSTANMIQGQRDYFGWHSFGRLDQDGVFHGPWI